MLCEEVQEGVESSPFGAHMECVESAIGVIFRMSSWGSRGSNCFFRFVYTFLEGKFCYSSLTFEDFTGDLIFVQLPSYRIVRPVYIGSISFCNL